MANQHIELRRYIENKIGELDKHHPDAISRISSGNPLCSDYEYLAGRGAYNDVLSQIDNISRESESNSKLSSRR